MQTACRINQPSRPTGWSACSLSSLLLAALLCPALPASGVELRLTGPESTLIGAGAGAHTIRVEVDTDAERDPVRLVAEIRLWKTNDPAVAVGAATVKPGAGGQVVRVPVTVPRPGLYDLTIAAFRQGREPVGHAATTFAVVPPRTAVGPSDLGVCTHFAQGKGALPRSLDLVKLAGFSRIRDEMYWDAVEKTPGMFVFPDRLTRYLTEADRLGLAPLVVLCYGNARPYPEAFRGSQGFPESPAARQAFVRYAVECCRRYGDLVKAWEVWNEPHAFGKATPEHYTELLKAVYPALKAVRKDAYIVSCGGGGAGGGPGGDWISAVLGNSGLDDQDGFSIHPYMSPNSPDLGYATVGSIIPRVNVPVVWDHLGNFIARHPRSDGRRLDLWVTEIGWFDAPTPGQNGELDQAAYLARTFLLSRHGRSARAVFWYDFQDDGVNPERSEDHFGLIRRDFSPKAAYVAAAVMTATVGERPWTRSLVDSDEARAFQYGEGRNAVVAVWSVKPQDAVVSLALEAGSYVVRDWQGQERTITVGDRPVPFPARPNPQYIVRTNDS
jgi:hypothetical protein